MEHGSFNMHEERQDNWAIATDKARQVSYEEMQGIRVIKQGGLGKQWCSANKSTQ